MASLSNFTPFVECPSFDDLVKSLNLCFSVIPAEAGIHFFQMLTTFLDSGFHRSDDFYGNISFDF